MGVEWSQVVSAMMDNCNVMRGCKGSVEVKIWDVNEHLNISGDTVHIDWALGVLHMKILIAVIMMGPQWYLKRAIEWVYNDGIRNINMHFFMAKICVPVSTALGLALAIPYVIAHSIVPLFDVGFETQTLVVRRIYPFLLTLLVCLAMLTFQVRQFRRLYNHIKDQKYLVGQRLVNYIHHHHTSSHDANRLHRPDAAAS